MRYILLLLSVIGYSLQASTAEIKTKDLNNKVVDSTTSSEENVTITPEQMAELKKQIEVIKENQKKAEELMKELEEGK
jgi:hypothetical protein